MNDKKLTRRGFLRIGALTAAGAALAGCAPKVVKETVVVERPVEKVVKETVMVEGTPQVVEKVVTATPAPKEPVTIEFTSNELWEIYDPLVWDLIEERGLNVKLTGERTIMDLLGTGYPGFCDNVITRLAAGDQLDIIHIAVHGLFTLIAKNVVRPLDEFIDADPEFKKDIEEDIHPKLMELLQWQGKQYQIPGDWNNMIIHYNHKMFEENGIADPKPDWTWDDFLETSLAVADVHGTEDDVYAYSWENWTFGMDPWFFNNDTSVVTDDWLDSNMLDPKVAETLQYMSDLISVHKAAPVPAGWDEYGQFVASHQAMRSCGGWCMRYYWGADFEDYKFQYQPTNRGGPIKTVVGTAGDSMTTACRHPEEAWEVMKILCGPEVQMNFLTLDGALQARRSVVETEQYRNLTRDAPADMSIFYESLDYAKRSVTPPNYNILEPLLGRWLDQLWAGEISVDECVQGAHAELQPEMDKMKRDLGL